jgi:aminoglycoside/choline kinase family phosphotransferase
MVGPAAADWDRVCDILVRSALAQPAVPVHRDWMPRNLMLSDPNPGILDFQDAVLGPVTYDIASLLRDAFLSWDEEREIDWAVRWWQQIRATPRCRATFSEDFGMLAPSRMAATSSQVPALRRLAPQEPRQRRPAALFFATRGGQAMRLWLRCC